MVFFAWTKLNQAPLPIAQEQKKQALENILGREVRVEKVISQGENIHTGKFFSLSYPVYAKVYDRKNPNITNNKNLLEYLRLDSEEPKFRFVMMVGRTDETAVLDELSAVRTRVQNRSYQKLPVTIDGNDGLLFVKESGGVERSSFFLVNGKSYSFSITGVDSSELEKVYGKIMESVKF